MILDGWTFVTSELSGEMIRKKKSLSLHFVFDANFFLYKYTYNAIFSIDVKKIYSIGKI